jgi:Transposase DNA-binding/Transposase Tn5 dimerisation domain
MENWASLELEHVELGDARRNKRLVRIVEDLAAQPTSSVPQACGSLAAACAAYDFWSSPYFSPDDIRDGHIKSTIERVKEHNIVLMIQGGFLGRKGDGEPGVKTIWRGLRRLHDIAATWKLAHQTQ